MYQAVVLEEPLTGLCEKGIDQTVSCKRCGKILPYAELYKINAFIYLCPKNKTFSYLCPDCFKESEAWSRNFSAYIKRFIAKSL